MKRAGRKFDIYAISAEDVERLQAWKSLREVSFTYDDSRRLRRVRKRNTFLFDALTDIAGYEYDVSDGVNEDMLYETIVVDFERGGEVRCLQAENGVLPGVLPAAELEKTLYEHGFYVERADGRRVHFVPFVASASMSREDEYLFVNEERLDALLRAVSLDMVAAVDGMSVLDGMPADGGSGEFGKLQRDARVASVPKLAAYLGLALSDGVSLREVCTAQEQQDVSGWLLGLNENNTVCVADWGNAPTLLDAFQHCWVNEEIPRAAGQFLSRNTGDKQTKLQERLQELFRALYGADRAAFDNLLAAEDVCRLWQQAISSFFRLNMSMELRESRIPHLPDSHQGTSVYQAATLYAACLFAEEGEFLLSAMPVAQCDMQVLTQTDLLFMVERLFREERLRNHLWNMFHEQDPSVNHVVEATTGDAGVQLKMRLAPCTVFRATLRHIGWKSRHGKGQLYDGCGFLDDELFEKLEEMLGLEGTGLNAVQIRLPWCKGLLVRFTATEFFRQWTQWQGQRVSGMTICDVFGRQRPLFDEAGRPLIRAFFTASMFKGKGWFGRLEDKTESGVDGDRWAEYWRRLRAHGASLLIAGRSTPPAMKSRLNYQFLTTLGLEAGELHMLAERRLRQLADALHPGGNEDGEGLAELLMGLNRQEEEEIPDLATDEDDPENEPVTDDPDDEPAGDEPEGAGDPDEAEDAPEDYLTLLARALVAHPRALRSTSLVMDRYDSLVRSEVQHMMRGRLSVSGDVRYLVPDLMQMLRYMARRFLFLPDGSQLRQKENGAEAGKGIRSASLVSDRGGNFPYGSYYAPGDNVPWRRRTGKLGKAGTLMDVAILRNPHYAQGEAPILRPLDDTQRAEYDLWFSHLTGCVMVPSAVMYTINGADCDGDRVNVCAEPTVLTAIRRRAKRENSLLLAVISRRGEILRWLGDMENASSKANVKRYWRLLQEELPRILPEPSGRPFVVRDCFPPLVYAGSAAVGAAYSPEDLDGEHLRDKLWDAFCMSRRQRIGVMSLKVLKMTASAYGDIPADAEKNMTPRQLLSSFLARYRLVSGALDTAMEIDMAKTGSVRENQPVLKVPEDVLDFLGLKSESGFSRWHALYKKCQRRLNGYGFNGALETLMTDFSKAWKAPDSAGMGLDLLPMIVYHLFAPQKAALLTEPPVKTARPEAAKKPSGRRARPVVQEGMLGSSGHRKVRSVMRRPTAPDVVALTSCDSTGTSLLQELEGCLKRYDRARRVHSRALKAHEGMKAAYSAVMRWMLFNGFSLNDALAGMDLLRGMINRWHMFHPAGMKRLCDMFGMLMKLAKDQEANVQWGWTADAARRGRQLDNMLRQAYGATGALPVKLGFTDPERALLCCSRRSIVLVRLMAELGWRESLMHEMADMGRAMTPDELEGEMRAAIARRYPDRVDELLCAACYQLRERHYVDDSGNRCALMSDFLMTYLLRTQLVDVIIDPAEEGGERP